MRAHVTRRRGFIGSTLVDRLDTLQAVVLSAQLRQLDAWNAARVASAGYYGENPARLKGLVRRCGVRLDDALRYPDCGTEHKLHSPTDGLVSLTGEEL